MSEPPPPDPVRICADGFACLAPDCSCAPHLKGERASKPCKCGGNCKCGSAIVQKPDDARGGDPGFWEAHAELWPLHVGKADGYGTVAEPFANYINTSEQLGQPDEYTPMVRIIEKLERAKNLVLDGRADECKEWLDIAALALGAEALRRRRL